MPAHYGPQRQLFDPSRSRGRHWNHPHHQARHGPNEFAEFRNQCLYLDRVAEKVVAETKMDDVEKLQKGAFRKRLESICQYAFHTAYPEAKGEVFLRGFGSLESGFATKGSDVDLGISFSTDFAEPSTTFARDFPRILEQSLLHASIGTRLLTRTRVPILKICEEPDSELFAALKEERKKWDDLSDEQKYPGPDTNDTVGATADPGGLQTTPATPLNSLIELKSVKRLKHVAVERYCEEYTNLAYECIKNGSLDITTARKYFLEGLQESLQKAVSEKVESLASQNVNLQIMKTEILKASKDMPPADAEEKVEKRWTREKARGPLDFPKSGVGIQCDINFSSQLGSHNTELLRCYSLCDDRVAVVILFVKAWAKQRQINSAYSGTMSSYGYVLMVLHFLMNVESPPIIPNLQYEWPEKHTTEEVNGYSVKFLRDPALVAELCSQPQWKGNQSSVGIILRNFFKYYAGTAAPHMQPNHRFNWMRDVISIRTPGGAIAKDQKGWTVAKTTHTEQVSDSAICTVFKIQLTLRRPLSASGICSQLKIHSRPITTSHALSRTRA